MMGCFTTTKERRRLAALYDAGRTYAEVAELTGRSIPTVIESVAEHGTPRDTTQAQRLRRELNGTGDRYRGAAALYRHGATLEQAAAEFGIDRRHLSRWMRRRGIRTRPAASYLARVARRRAAVLEAGRMRLAGATHREIAEAIDGIESAGAAWLYVRDYEQLVGVDLSEAAMLRRRYQQVATMRAFGMSYAAIAREVGVSESAVRRCHRRELKAVA